VNRQRDLFPEGKAQSELAAGTVEYGKLQIRVVNDGIRSEKCVVRRFRRCANVIECTYTNLQYSIAHYKPRLYGITCCF
jgi:hypothetical protein